MVANVCTVISFLVLVALKIMSYVVSQRMGCVVFNRESIEME